MPRTRMAGQSPTLDLERQERGRHFVSPASRVWFTLSHGILNEIYYPRVDQACTRDMGLIITDGTDFFSEEKRHASPR